MIQRSSIEHKLVAVLMADVVGYSHLIGVDEDGTLRALKEHRVEVFAPSIAEHNGRIVKLMGDGLLAEFPSAVYAMSAAIEIQRAMATRNSAEGGRIDYRIGVHLGDVAVDEDDILEVAISVAARLEAEAAPGGICLSDHMRAQIAGKLDLELTDGEQAALKNIDEPIRI
ncbi:MAG: adenylate/guanylate cyclase domain-containing protein [Pseudomonadota bacterium]